jgi:IS30 family transposase
MILQRNNRLVVLEHIQAGLSYQQIANGFGVDRSTISRIHQRFHTTGTVNYRRKHGQRRERQDVKVSIFAWYTLPIGLVYQQKLLELFQGAEIRRSLLSQFADI